MEKQGIDPCTLRMLSEYSTIWATSPFVSDVELVYYPELTIFEKKYCFSSL